MIGYILLISLGIVMAVMVYSYIKTYVPSDVLECPAGTSLMIKDSKCINGSQINITIKNNGKFNIKGMMVLATTSPDQEIATTDLTRILNQEPGMGDGSNAINSVGPYIIFSMDGEEKMRVNDEYTYVFDLNESFPELYDIEIIPIRYQREGGSIMHTVCGEGKAREALYCN